VPSFGQVTLDAAATAIGNLMLGERCQEASCGPASASRRDDLDVLADGAVVGKIF
jgi:hypothetical protein